MRTVSALAVRALPGQQILMHGRVVRIVEVRPLHGERVCRVIVSCDGRDRGYRLEYVDVVIHES